MKTQQILTHSILSACAAALLIPAAHADSFGSGGNAFTIDFVDIGNANNAGAIVVGNPSHYGGVAYDYRMGVTEVPEDWITKATNLGMSNVTAGAWTGMQPAANMTWYEAAAFVNWLNTSTGHQAAYQLNAGNTALTLWASVDAWQLGGENLYRHKDAYYFLPSENEWYKAAYHKNDGVTANYWDYAIGSNTAPTAVASGTGDGTAVYNNVTTPGLPASPAAVDNDGGLSAYGTRGQGGNVYEWNESAYNGSNTYPNELRAFRGGFWGDTEDFLRSSFRDFTVPEATSSAIGFRVASVPEPSSTVLILSASLVALARRRRRAVL